MHIRLVFLGMADSGEIAGCLETSLWVWILLMNDTYALSTFDNETCFNCLLQIYFLFAFNC